MITGQISFYGDKAQERTNEGNTEAVVDAVGTLPAKIPSINQAPVPLLLWALAAKSPQLLPSLGNQEASHPHPPGADAWLRTRWHGWRRGFPASRWDRSKVGASQTSELPAGSGGGYTPADPPSLSGFLPSHPISPVSGSASRESNPRKNPMRFNAMISKTDVRKDKGGGGL